MSKKGFTLIELLIVIAIIGVLIAIAIAKFATLASDRNIKVCQANLRTIDSAIQIYRAEGTTHAASMAKLGTYLVKVPRCPSGGTYSITGSGTYATCGETGHTIPEG